MPTTADDLAAFRRRFEPLRVGALPGEMPPALRASAARLSRKVGARKTAYLFGVSSSSIYSWRASLR
jgi:hypothetical protein